jgi:hypothetical protein
MNKKIIKKLQELYDKIDEYGYAHPIQTRPKPSPGITGEKPGEVKGRQVGAVVFNRNFSSKKVNKSSNRKIEDEDNQEGG